MKRKTYLFTAAIMVATMLAGCVAKKTETKDAKEEVTTPIEEITSESETTSVEDVTKETKEEASKEETKKDSEKETDEKETKKDSSETKEEVKETTEKETKGEKETTAPKETKEEQTTKAPETTKALETTKAPETEAPETEAPTVKSVSATVNGTHYIGDTLTGADFTIKVTMSDGSVLTNPAGWSASPLALSNASNTITVTYNGVSSTVTVKASERPVETEKATEKETTKPTEKQTEKQTEKPVANMSAYEKHFKANGGTYVTQKDGSILIDGGIDDDGLLMIPATVDGKRVAGVGRPAKSTLTNSVCYIAYWSPNGFDIEKAVLNIDQYKEWLNGIYPSFKIIRKIDIEEGNTMKLAYGSFSCCAYVTEVKIPSTITKTDEFSWFSTMNNPEKCIITVNNTYANVPNIAEKVVDDSQGWHRKMIVVKYKDKTIEI